MDGRVWAGKRRTHTVSAIHRKPTTHHTHTIAEKEEGVWPPGSDPSPLHLACEVGADTALVEVLLSGREEAMKSVGGLVFPGARFA